MRLALSLALGAGRAQPRPTSVHLQEAKLTLLVARRVGWCTPLSLSSSSSSQRARAGPLADLLARSLAGGFNGGSTFAANVKAAVAITNTNLSAGFGGLAWMLMDYRLERKWSAVGYCTGAICGLVAITPAAGYVGYGCVGLPFLECASLVDVRRADERARTFLARSPSIFIGVVSAAISNLLTTLKGFFAFDDAMDIYACRASLSYTRARAGEHR